MCDKLRSLKASESSFDMIVGSFVFYLPEVLFVVAAILAVKLEAVLPLFFKFSSSMFDSFFTFGILFERD